MIYVLEGPDGCGKSTLFAAIRAKKPEGLICVPSPPMHKDLWPVMPHVERVAVSIWVALYDKRQKYLCDRHGCTTGPVYDRLFGRPYIAGRPLENEIHVLYLACPLTVLKARFAARGDEYIDDRSEELLALYEEEIRNFRHSVFDATRPVDELVDKIRSVMCC